MSGSAAPHRKGTASPRVVAYFRWPAGSSPTRTEQRRVQQAVRGGRYLAKRGRPAGLAGELIITTRGLGECVSGVILYDETIRQSRADGVPFVKVFGEAGIVPGIKVDTHARDTRGTYGREDHRRARRIARPSPGVFQDGGAVRQMAGGDRSRRTPSEPRLHRRQRPRSGALRRPLQEAELVPIVEHKVLMEGDHAMARCGGDRSRLARGFR